MYNLDVLSVYSLNISLVLPLGYNPQYYLVEHCEQRKPVSVFSDDNNPCSDLDTALGIPWLVKT